MRLGIDFDNTIVSYDQLYHRLALERGLIPDSVPRNKNAVRDYLRAQGREPQWTELQGIGYGSRILEAEPFPHLLTTLTHLRQLPCDIYIISHKTKCPYLGQPVDLHQSARHWLAANGLLAPQGPIAPSQVFFEETMAAKVQRIASTGCASFIDDIPAVLTHPQFPSGTQRLLFDPVKTQPLHPAYKKVSSWLGVYTFLHTAHPNNRSQTPA